MNHDILPIPLVYEFLLPPSIWISLLYITIANLDLNEPEYKTEILESLDFPYLLSPVYSCFGFLIFVFKELLCGLIHKNDRLQSGKPIDYQYTTQIIGLFLPDRMETLQVVLQVLYVVWLHCKCS